MNGITARAHEAEASTRGMRKRKGRNEETQNAPSGHAVFIRSLFCTAPEQKSRVTFTFRARFFDRWVPFSGQYPPDYNYNYYIAAWLVSLTLFRRSLRFVRIAHGIGGQSQHPYIALRRLLIVALGKFINAAANYVSNDMTPSLLTILLPLSLGSITMIDMGDSNRKVLGHTKTWITVDCCRPEKLYRYAHFCSMCGYNQ